MPSRQKKTRVTIGLVLGFIAQAATLIAHFKPQIDALMGEQDRRETVWFDSLREQQRRRDATHECVKNARGNGEALACLALLDRPSPQEPSR